MAERRMFSKAITESSRFLKMPATAQNLYFHLAMNADDDGVVEAYNILNLIKANEDDLKVLLSKGYVKLLNEDLVAYISDWREHNHIRSDRKRNSVYLNLLLEVVPEIQILKPKGRSDCKKGHSKKSNSNSVADNGASKDRPMTDNGPSMDGQNTAQDRIGEDRIGEDRRGEVRLGKGSLDNRVMISNRYQEIVGIYNTVFKGIIYFEDELTNQDCELIDNLLGQYNKSIIRQVFEFIAEQKRKGEMERFTPHLRGILKRNVFMEKLNRMNKTKQQTYFNPKEQQNYDFERLEEEIVVKGD